MTTLHYIIMVTLSLSVAAGAADSSGGTALAPPNAPEITEKTTGDVVTLKSGRILQGVRILQSTPFKLYLEVLPDIEPLAIPIRQVASVTYGPPETELTPAPNSKNQENNESATNVLQAVKISPDLLKKMNAPIAEKTVEFASQDLINTLRSTGIMSGVTVTIGPRLEAMPSEKRNVSLTLQGGLSLDQFLRQVVAPAVPSLKIEYRFDSIYFDSL